MKVRSLAGAILAVTLAGTSAVSLAKDQGHGEITFKGAIIDAPCSIAQESQYQTVEMDQISNVALKNGGKSNPKTFKIELRGCELSAMKSATATFTGTPSSNPDLLAIKGTAQGASLAIADHTGTLLKLGSASPAQTLTNGNTSLQFSAYLQGDMVTPEGGGAAESAEIVPGNFETVANFTLAYQ
ncbi:MULTISPECIES: fimbrial protein [Pseudomonas chlororaphis group]|uniref:fimbrial protein n=1 Tax=Pseudomonas chlororaphis group TaxID=136842 RepID=UPI00209858BA|nr:MULTISPECIES: fimbrial protein [Pseudomonas chlororaphis group]MCO7580382.1 type 1 fimbrial protein [Pseudomonas protegens]MCO7586501.1 type 1 fimbrial protein [Pseudomonas chlororaphis]MCO7603534.1 type 1 fimbrial protein [Pseudomonas chlororaphis]